MAAQESVPFPVSCYLLPIMEYVEYVPGTRYIESQINGSGVKIVARMQAFLEYRFLSNDEH